MATSASAPWAARGTTNNVNPYEDPNSALNLIAKAKKAALDKANAAAQAAKVNTGSTKAPKDVPPATDTANTSAPSAGGLKVPSQSDPVAGVPATPASRSAEGQVNTGHSQMTIPSMATITHLPSGLSMNIHGTFGSNPQSFQNPAMLTQPVMPPGFTGYIPQIPATQQNVDPALNSSVISGAHQLMQSMSPGTTSGPSTNFQYSVDQPNAASAQFWQQPMAFK
jgi:hypothetical protein